MSKNAHVVIDDSIPTAAKIEIAEYRRNPNHTIRYKPSQMGFSHLVFHELTHLELILEARQEDENYIFASTAKNENSFLRKAEKEKKRMIKGGLPEENVKPFLQQMFNGINLQMYNAPIDLFIEQRFYDRNEHLRPIQLLSLLNIHKQGIAGANDATAKKIAPRFVRDTNIILTFTQLFQLRDLFGIDLTAEINEPILLKKAQSIYNEYKKMRDDKQAGEEYDLLKWWAEDLSFESYFTLIPEKSNASNKQEDDNEIPLKFPHEVMEEIENDPYQTETSSSFEDKQMKTFVAANKKNGTNMAVVIHMIDALQYFADKPKEKAKEAGIEIAELGNYGINPKDKETYSLRSIPQKSFSGWKLLAYMYVSWSIFEPRMVKQLQLDFHDEFDLAKTLSNQ